MIVVLSGAPGAGKGTQGDLLAARCGFRKISTGDALRNQVKLKTQIGLKAEAIMATGNLVPDGVLFEILRTELGTRKDERILLDGYPRNVNQAETLSTLGDVHPVAGVIHLDVKRENLVRRLSGRRVCSKCGATYNVEYKAPKRESVCDNCGGEVAQRADDQADKVAVRLDVFSTSTEPVFDFYRRRSLYTRLDGEGDTEEVFSRLQEVVHRLLKT